VTDVAHAMTLFLELHSDEELIRLRRRAQLAGYEELAKILSKEITQREQTAKELEELPR
jgi:hypothetical protein